MDYNKINEIKLFDADTLEYTGSIMVTGGKNWEYRDVENENLMSMTKNLPLKGVLSSLISFNMVYEIVDYYLE